MKRRTQGDYMALGALLFIADKALLKALVLIGHMYPMKSEEFRRVDRLSWELRDLRFELDNRWKRVATEPVSRGAEPFYFGTDTGFDPLDRALEAIEDLRRLREEWHREDRLEAKARR